MTNYRGLLERLLCQEVEFILIGGLAAVVHGSSRFTADVDIVYSRTRENLSKLVQALSPIQPYLRGAPPGLPFLFDVDTLHRGLNFTLDTDLGPIDLLGEVAGAGSYGNLLPDSVEARLFGHACRVVKLDRLIALKRAAGRPKDLEAIAELEALRQSQYPGM